MLLTDIAFLIIITLFALIFLVLGLIYKGVLWFPIISAIMWLLLGFFCINRDQYGTELFMFQRELGALFIVMGIAVFLMPWWNKEKKADVIDELNDQSITFEKPESDYRQRVSQYRQRIREQQGKKKDEFIS